ncbi:MAG: type II toxin-antitoxin system RelE/ParE family toxin [Dehalococcoidia bacterium]|nr:type II toxin-antitoxin system RelE/ParE family toxin [Dehalococcoidia bacterium]
MSYEVVLRRAAHKGLGALSEKDYLAAGNAISSLEEDPRPARVKKLGDSGLWRIRVRQYRVVYAIDDETRTVTVVRVARRQQDTS